MFLFSFLVLRKDISKEEKYDLTKFGSAKITSHENIFLKLWSTDNISSFYSGIPTCIVASHFEMSDWGGSNAKSFKLGINSIFDEKEGEIPVKRYHTHKIDLHDYWWASVNTGHLSGLKVTSSTKLFFVMK